MLCTLSIPGRLKTIKFQFTVLLRLKISVMVYRPGRTSTDFHYDVSTNSQFQFMLFYILILCLLHYLTGQGEGKGNSLFNDALNTFYLLLYGVEHMVKDHSDSERGNLLPPHRLLFPINSKVPLYAPSHRQDNTYHGLCYTSRGALAGTRIRLKISIIFYRPGRSSTDFHYDVSTNSQFRFMLFYILILCLLLYLTGQSFTHFSTLKQTRLKKNTI